MLSRIVILALGAIFLFQTQANAQIETNWIFNPGSANFSNPANWTDGIPGISDTAIFDIEGTAYSVVMDMNVGVDELDHVSGECSLFGPSKLTVASRLELDSAFFGVGQSCTLAGLNGLSVGVNNTGNLTVVSGSLLDIEDDIVLGEDENTTGLLNSRPGTTVNSDTMIVGAGGTGTLLASGNTVTHDELVIGDLADADGLVEIDAGATVSNDCTIVGMSGRGDICMDSNAELFTNEIICGNNLGGVGAIVLIGDGSIEAGDVTLGLEGDGVILMGNGSFCCDTVDIGVMPSSQGGIGVAENADFVCGQLNVGLQGVGELLIRDSGSISALEITINDGSTVCFQDSASVAILQASNGIVAEGLIKFESGFCRITGDVTLQGDGEIETVEATTISQIIGDLHHEGLEVYINQGAYLEIAGEYSGAGEIDGGGNVLFLGAVTPGPGPQVVDYDVQVALRPNSDLKIEIGGTQLGQYDRLNVGGDLTLSGGELSVAVINGFVPEPGDSFVIADVDGNIDGTFGGLPSNSIFTSDDGFEFEIVYDTDSDQVVLIAQEPAILLGDVNMDGIVNLLDVAPFVAAITTGTFVAEADINQDGNVDLLDVAPMVDILTN